MTKTSRYFFVLSSTHEKSDNESPNQVLKEKRGVLEQDGSPDSAQFFFLSRKLLGRHQDDKGILKTVEALEELDSVKALTSRDKLLHYST